MLVELIIPTYSRPDLLKCMLYSLVSQVNPNWGATVVIDNPDDNKITDLIKSINDDRIRRIRTDKRYNDWGHTPREIGKQLSSADYIIMTGDDNYYTPNFIQELHIASITKPGVIYWDMVHSHYDYSYFKCAPAFNQIDMGAFATRKDIAHSIKLNTTYAADGEYIESIKHKFPTEEMIKINKVLFVHN